ncbi:SapC family protein [Halopseudomonas salegens]|uniref:SapC protein n=1 Tax=Halopseudomonas salegens TaxID=1434072 RepID=A0A1H2G5Y5_9GAMM|nr:SapC family protein [Halopseudomonas salegens]SDU15013.1 SapC protein [Halopseudomonas salegens]
MKTLFLYNSIKPLDRQAHRNLRVSNATTFEFARDAQMVPINGAEFFSAARSFPLLFIGREDNISPVALMGLTEGHNRFLQADGQWQESTYVPAFVRRYPFMFADTGAEELTICIDEDFAGWNEQEGRELFTDNGEYSTFLQSMVGLMQNYFNDSKQTRAFVLQLQKLNLLVPRSVKMTHRNGKSFTLQDFYAVDEKRLRQLGDADVLELNRQGFLGLIYAHLMSLGNINVLFEDYLNAGFGSDAKH